MRPTRLINKPETGHYRIAINGFIKNCMTISRADVAHYMINNIANEKTYKAIVEIAYWQANIQLKGVSIFRAS